MGRKKQNVDYLDGGFVALPHVVTNTQKYASLSAHAVKLLVDIARQLRGSNNGDLQATWSLLGKRGWRSKSTLYKATVELEAVGFIQMTRRGGKNMGPHLWAVTWRKIDEIRIQGGGLKTDSKPTLVPSRLYLDKITPPVLNLGKAVRNTG